MNNSNYEGIYINKINYLLKMAKKNKKEISKLQRIIYLLKNNTKIYKGSRGGYFYYTKNSKIYI